MSLLQLAEQQLTGYAHASKGFGIEDLAQSMGLKKSEWEKIKARKLVDLKPLDVEYLDAYFLKKYSAKSRKKYSKMLNGR